MSEEEDEGVYDESPDNSQLVEFLPKSSPCTNIVGSCRMTADDDQIPSQESRPLYHTMVPADTAMPAKVLPRPIVSCDAYWEMSVARMSCFLFSIAVCLVYVTSILWLIPCQLTPCLPPFSSTQRDIPLNEWTQRFPFVYITAIPQSVVVNSAKETFIILAYQTVHGYNDSEVIQLENSRSLSGILALRATDGKEVWNLPFYTDIIDVLCNVIDINADGFYDCLVTGAAGLVAAMKPSTGQIFWYLHNHDHSVRFAAISSVQPLPDTDFDDDGVNDLIAISLLMHDQHSNHQICHHLYINCSLTIQLLFVSGSTGQTIGLPLPLPLVFITNENTHNNTLSLPTTILYTFWNGSLALLIFSNTGVHATVDTGTQEHIYLLLIRDLYQMAIANCSSYPTKIENVENICSQSNLNVKEIYSGEHGILFLQPIRNKTGNEGILMYAESGEISLLNGSTDLQPRWTLKLPGHKLSKPVLGFYDDDAVLDVFFTATPLNCSENDCKSQAIICDGKDGHILQRIVTLCTTFSPAVISDHFFLFKTLVLSDLVHELEMETTSPTVTNDLTPAMTKDQTNTKQMEKNQSSTSNKNHLGTISKTDNTNWSVKLSAFVGRNYGNFSLDLLTGETTMCHCDPEKFKVLTLHKSNQWHLVSIQNEEKSSLVTLIKIPSP